MQMQASEVSLLFKKLLSILLAAALIPGFSACSLTSGKNVAPQEELKISYYNVKYGDNWIKSLTEAYKKQHPNVKITLIGDSHLNSSIVYSLMSGTDEPDIAFVSQTNWELWANDGYLTDLTGLYNTVTDDGKSFKDKLQPDLADYGEYKGVYRVVPWGDGVAGLIYNKKMFDQNGWNVPTTVNELDSLMDNIKYINIAPFAWSGADMGYWGSAVNGWWTQYEGVAGMQDYLKMDKPDVYNQSGRLAALVAFQNVIKDPHNSIEDPEKIDAKTAISNFYSGKAAMMPGGYLTLMETKYKPPKDFKMLMMRLPAVAGAKQPYTCGALAGNFAFIPSNAKNVKLAKDFLIFMASDKALSLFTQDTGSPAPFTYEAELTPGLDDLALSEAKLWRDSGKVYMYSKNPVYYNDFLDWPCGGSPLMQIYAGSETAQQAFERNYSYAMANWAAISSKYNRS